MTFEMLRWLALGFGFIYFITESAIFMPIRVILARGSSVRTLLLYCPACTGFWLGLMLGVGQYWPGEYGDDWLMGLRESIESGIALMAVGAIWGAVHINDMYMLEAELRGETAAKPDDSDEETEDNDEA